MTLSKRRKSNTHILELGALAKAQYFKQP